MKIRIPGPRGGSPSPLFFGRINEQSFVQGSSAVSAERGAFPLWSGAGLLGLRIGAEPRLVYLHGLGSSASELLPLARRVAGAAILIDLPGFGLSPFRPDLSLAALARRIRRALTRDPGPGPFIFIGASFGAQLAARIAIDAPEMVAGLVLVSAALDPKAREKLGPRFSPSNLRRRSPERVRQDCRALVCHPNAATEDFARRRARVQASGRLAPLIHAARVAIEDDAPARLEAVDAPAALIHGANDPLAPLAATRSAARRLSDAPLTVLDDTGHLPWLERPDQLARAIRRTIEGWS